MGISAAGFLQPRVLSPSLRVAKSPRIGRGVFADKDFKPGELIESAQVIVIPAEQWPLLEKTELFNYGYAFGEDLTEMAIALGFGSLYNHSYTPNARYLRRCREKTIDFLALRPIAAGEEITVNYNGTSTCRDPLWFPIAE